MHCTTARCRASSDRSIGSGRRALRARRKQLLHGIARTKCGRQRLRRQCSRDAVAAPISAFRKSRGSAELRRASELAARRNGCARNPPHVGGRELFAFLLAFLGTSSSSIRESSERRGLSGLSRFGAAADPARSALGRSRLKRPKLADPAAAGAIRRTRGNGARQQRRFFGPDQPPSIQPLPIRQGYGSQSADYLSAPQAAGAAPATDRAAQ